MNSFIKTLVTKEQLTEMLVAAQNSTSANKVITKGLQERLLKWSDYRLLKAARKTSKLDIALCCNNKYYIRYAIA